jgi:type III pantothenate kinase
MLLVLDVGNSHTKTGLYDGDQLLANWRIVTSLDRTADELRALLYILLQQGGFDPKAVEGCCISSVVPPLNHDLQQMSRDGFGVDPLMIGPGIRTGLIIQVENPKEVGADRICNAVAAIEAYGGPLIVVGFGTATTFDAITAKAEYRGGVIAPGIQISADALFERCAKLPRVDLTVPTHVIGRDTVSHIRSGLIFGYADLTDGIVRRIAAEMGGVKPKVVATGGFAELISGVATCIEHVDAFLSLKGLKIIYDKNMRSPE